MMEAARSSGTSVHLHRLHGVVSQKTKVFVVTAIKASILT